MEQAPQTALDSAQANADSGLYEYSDVPKARFTPFSPAKPYVLGPEQSFRFRQPRDRADTVAQPGCTVWMLDVTGKGDFWRVYAMRSAVGECFVLSAT